MANSFYPLTKNGNKINAPRIVVREDSGYYYIYWGNPLTRNIDDVGTLYSVQIKMSGGNIYNYLTGHEDFESAIDGTSRSLGIYGSLAIPATKIGSKPKTANITVWDISKATNGIIVDNGNLTTNIPWICSLNDTSLFCLFIPQSTTYTTPKIQGTSAASASPNTLDLTDENASLYYVNYDPDFLKNDTSIFKNMVEYEYNSNIVRKNVGTSYKIEKEILAQNSHEYHTIRASGIIEFNNSIIYATDVVTAQVKYTPVPAVGRIYETNNTVFSYTPILEDQAVGVYNDKTATYYNFYASSWTSSEILTDDCGPIFGTILNGTFEETPIVSASGLITDLTITKTTSEASLSSGIFIFGAKGVNSVGESDYFLNNDKKYKLFVYDASINSYSPPKIMYPLNNSIITDTRITSKVTATASMDCEYFLYEKIEGVWTQVTPVGITTSSTLVANTSNNVFIGNLRDNTDYCLVALGNVTTVKIPDISYFRVATKGTAVEYTEAEATPSVLTVNTNISNKYRYAVGLSEVSLESNIYDPNSVIVSKPKKLKRKVGKIFLSCNALYDKTLNTLPAKFYISLDKERTWTQINPINFEQTTDEAGNQIPVILFVNSVFNETSRSSLKNIYGKNCFLDVSDSGYFIYKVILIGNPNNTNYSPMLETIKFKIIYQ